MATGLETAAGVLGIVGVTYQIAQSAQKIRTFCKEVKDAPAELEALTHSVESLDTILIRLKETAMTDSDIVSKVNADILSSSLMGCQRAVERISSFVTKARHTMKTRRFRGSCTFVLKRRELKAMQENLDSSKLDLLIATTTYYASNARTVTYLQTTVIQNLDDQTFVSGESDGYAHARNVTYLPASPVLDSDDQTISAYEDQPVGYAREWPPNVTAVSETSPLRVQLPRWLCEHAWDISWQRAAGRWTFSMKSFRTLE